MTPNILIIGRRESVRRHVDSLTADGAFRCTCVNAPEDTRTGADGLRVDAAVLDTSCLDESDCDRLMTWLRREAGEDVPLVVVSAQQTGDDVYAAVARAVERGRTVRRSPSRTAIEIERRAAALMCASAETMIGCSAALQAWVSVLYGADVLQVAHLRRVEHMSAELAAMAGVDASGIAAIRQAALLHDIGKLALPRELRRKTAPLSPDETEMMRTHARVAYDVAMSAPSLRPVADTLHAVCEQWAGTGYPRRLRGMEIPLAARIIALAETGDVIGSATASDGAMQNAGAALVAGAGTAFDPDLVRLWFRCVDTGAMDAIVRAWRDLA